MANLRAELDIALFPVLNVAAITNLATGGVHNTQALPDSDFPYVIYQYISKIDVYATYTIRSGEAIYMVKALSDKPWPKEALDIDTQIDAALQDANLSISGFTQLRCRRENDMPSLIEDLGGKTIHQIGGIYRITADET